MRNQVATHSWGGCRDKGLALSGGAARWFIQAGRHGNDSSGGGMAEGQHAARWGQSGQFSARRGDFSELAGGAALGSGALTVAEPVLLEKGETIAPLATSCSRSYSAMTLAP